MSVIMPTYQRLPVTFVRGEGSRVFDAAGRAYLDGLSGIAVTNLGHSHPAITEAINRQAGTLLHTSNLYHIEAQEQLADRLAEATGMEQLFFCNSGSEANEAAIKLARRYGHLQGIEQPTIVVLESAFHGRTMGSLAATDGESKRAPFAPMLPGFVRVARNDLAAVQALSNDKRVVAVLVEPIQGEGGVWTLDDAYLAGLRALCDQQNWLLMFDEVQSGNGRCGSLYAFQRLGITPDVLTTAKGLGNGFPIGCCMARGTAATVLGPGDHGTTFGGNPLGCAVALAVLDTLESEQLWQRADPIRESILAAVKADLHDPNTVSEIRGTGLMIGLEVTVPSNQLVADALTHGSLINVAAGNTLRLLPPVTYSDEEARELGSLVAGVINRAQENTP